LPKFPPKGIPVPNHSRIVFINGQYLPEASATISPLDRGFLYGDGLFETLRSVGGLIVSYQDHMERLKQGCVVTGISLPFTPVKIREFVRELLMRNDLLDAGIRIMLTRGVSETFGFGHPKNVKPTFIVHVRPYSKLAPELYENGVSVNLKTCAGHNSRTSTLKSISALEFVLTKQEALDADCYEMILTDQFDNVLEGTSSNIFMVKDRVVRTPPLSDHILGGITRKRVLEILEKKMRSAAVETKLTRSDLLSADEVFITNTHVEILPVTKIEEKIIGNGKIGSRTSDILKTFRQTLTEILE